MLIFVGPFFIHLMRFLYIKFALCLAGMLKRKEKESSRQLLKSNVGLEEQKLEHTWSKAYYILFPMCDTQLHVTVSASNMH